MDNNDLEVLAIIPARGGSKGIPRKNLALLGGRPLLSFTADSTVDSESLHRVVVSTDDVEIAEVAKSHGLEVPFLRPPELSDDLSAAREVILHALEWLLRREGYRPSFVVYLQPTSPFRTAWHIDQSVASFKEKWPDALVSVVKVPHIMNPESALLMRSCGLVEPFIGDCHGRTLRQEKQVFYARNGPAIFISTPRNLFEHSNLYEGNVMAFEMSRFHSHDIDEPEDLQLAEIMLQYLNSER